MGSANGGSGNGNVMAGGAGQGISGSPVKESSFLNRETSAEEVIGGEEKKDAVDRFADSVSPPPIKEGIPIRR